MSRGGFRGGGGRGGGGGGFRGGRGGFGGGRDFPTGPPDTVIGTQLAVSALLSAGSARK